MSTRPARAGRQVLGLLATASLAGTLVVAQTSAAVAAPPDPSERSASQTTTEPPKGDELGQADRDKLADALAEGTPTVTVMVVAVRSEVARARNEVRRLGGSIRYAADELGYFSAVLPTDKVEEAVALPIIEALDLDEVVPLPEVKPDRPGKPSPVASGGPSASTPDDNAFMPTRETGSTTFKRQHPTWDGRGVTIGVIDSGVDLAHPALQTTSTGERKIIDTFTATDPVTEGSLVAGGDATWLRMSRTATGPTASIGGIQYTVPTGTTYKAQLLVERNTDLAGGEILGDVNRDGDTSDLIGVLLDPKKDVVLVDSDDDKDFTDEKPMKPYREAFDQGVLGTDKPKTDVVEAMPFTVDVRRNLSLAPLGAPTLSSDFVDIGIVSGAHGSHVAGITAANDMFGGAMDGQAPGAQVVSARACSFGPGCTAAALTDGMAELAANRGVDIINMSIGGLPALNDGDNARARLYDRIIDEGVQLVISAGNSGNALNTIGDPSVATDVVSVGASISKETWKANYGADVAFSHGMLTFSSGGPREDGGFKPNITAPGSAISTTPTWQPGGPVAEAGYPLPAGYSMFNGTSMASPQAAGAMALLLSGAEQDRIKATSPAALRSAVYSSATYDSSIPAFLQGHGEIDVAGAYQLLKSELAPAEFTVTAPVCNEVWTILERTTGTGLYNRCAADAGGHAPGQATTYPVTITRTTGPKASGSYAVSLVGNDSTFTASPSSVTLPLGKPVIITVTATPAAGAHSAILRLDDSSTPGVDSSTMLAVVAGTDLVAPTFDTPFTGTSNRNEAQRFYVTVPAGAKALQLEMTGLATGAQTRFIAFHPYGLPIDSTSSLACYSNRPVSGGCNPAKRVYTQPQPGVWEVLVESRRTSPLASTPFTLTASVLGVTVQPASRDIPTAHVGTAQQLSWDVRNAFGTVLGGGRGGSLGSSLSETPTIADLAVQTRTVVVPEGAERLDVTIGSPSDTGADLDLFVTGPSGKKQSADGDSEESVTYLTPMPGTYTVTIDGYSVPAGTTTFDYRDVFTSAALGSLDITTGPVTLTSDALTTVEGTLTARSAVSEGRELFGAMRFVSDGGALLGTGTVSVGAVTGTP